MTRLPDPDKAKVFFTFTNEFGDTTEFSSSMESFITVEDMMSVFCRFLLACGYMWDNVKFFDPDFREEASLPKLEE